MDFMTVKDLQELLFYSVFFTDAEYIPVPSLFHYTKAAKKELIIKDNCIDLRLTRADSFEDKMEGEHILEVFRDAVNACLQSKQIDDHFSRLLLSAEDEFCDICETLRKHYVLCFSKNENNDYLAQNYACKNNCDGIVIGLQALDIECLNKNELQNIRSAKLLDVLYDEQILSSYIQRLICRMYQLKDQDDEQLSLCKKIAINQLTIYSLAYKSKEFQKEEETRLIVDVSRVDPERNRGITGEDDHYIHVLLGLKSLYNIREVTPHDQL